MDKTLCQTSLRTQCLFFSPWRRGEKLWQCSRFCIASCLTLILCSFAYSSPQYFVQSFPLSWLILGLFSSVLCFGASSILMFLYSSSLCASLRWPLFVWPFLVLFSEKWTKLFHKKQVIFITAFAVKYLVCAILRLHRL